MKDVSGIKKDRGGVSSRIKRLPPYLFAEIDRQKKILGEKGNTFIDLSVGDPDILAPRRSVEVLIKSALIKKEQKYALDQGKSELRKAIKDWMSGRFNVALDQDKEIVPLLGSKEGLVHFPLAFLNPGDLVIIPSPGYPGYRSAAILADAEIYELPLRPENGFLPDLDKIPSSVANKAGLIYLNYPNNPTSVGATEDFLRGLIKYCSRYGIIIAYDNAYSEIYFDDKPMSILQIPGAKEICLEFHSLSKTFCMTGFRIGWACGSPELASGLLTVKKNIDSGIFGAIQNAAAHALKHEKKYVESLRKAIRVRRDFFTQGLLGKGFKRIWADNTFYVWAEIPGKKRSSIEFAGHLLDKGVVVTPGVGFGRYGQGFIRFSLTTSNSLLKKALTKMDV